jgi:hypothetical protein
MCFMGWCLGNSSSTTYETADVLLKHGGKTGEELKAEGKWSSAPLRQQLKRLE